MAKRGNRGSLHENKGHSKYVYCITQYMSFQVRMLFKSFSDINSFCFKTMLYLINKIVATDYKQYY